MTIGVYQSQKPKEDPMAKALQMLHIGSAVSGLASKSPETTTAPNEQNLTSNETESSEVVPPNQVSGTNNKSSAMQRKFNSYGRIS